jgi:hypothetical protein
MTEQQIANRGRDAQQVLDNLAYQDAMKTLRDAVIQQWKDCPVRDKEGQLLLLQLVKITDKFEGILSGIIESGKLAQRKIEMDKLRDESKVKTMWRRVVNG